MPNYARPVVSKLNHIIIPSHISVYIVFHVYLFFCGFSFDRVANKWRKNVNLILKNKRNST